MNKGIFYIPLYQQKKDFSDILDEIILTIKFVDKKKFSEIYFGEHLTDRHEKIKFLPTSCICCTDFISR